MPATLAVGAGSRTLTEPVRSALRVRARAGWEFRPGQPDIGAAWRGRQARHLRERVTPGLYVEFIDDISNYFYSALRPPSANPRRRRFSPSSRAFMVVGGPVGTRSGLGVC
jgi:hypothetical protein